MWGSGVFLGLWVVFFGNVSVYVFLGMWLVEG